MVTGVAVLAVVVGIMGGLAAWGTAYDHSHADRLLPDTIVEGVPVGGMTASAAIDLLRDRLEGPLHRPITVRAGDYSLATTPWDLGLHVDVRAAVRKAQGEVTGGLLSRLSERLFTHPERIVAAPAQWQASQLDATLGGIADKVRVEAQDATASGDSGWAVVAPGKDGLELDGNRSKEEVTDAVRLGQPEVRLVTRAVPPAVGKDAFKQLILVRTGENKLYLYENGAISKSWSVATGSATYATPTGTWKVVDKLVDPSWYNPNSSW